MCHHFDYVGECVICEIEKRDGVQIFWRCEHHPIATENFFEKRTTCERGCHTSPLLWHQNGVHQRSVGV